MKRLRELEAENARLKKLIAEAELEKAMLPDVLGKTGKAHRKEASGWQSPGIPWHQPAPGLSAGADQS